MLSTMDFVIFGVGGVLLLIWLFFFVKGLRYAHYFDNLTEKEFPLKEIYFVGYSIMETIRYPYRSKGDRKLRKEVGVLYGEKYADYYIRVVYAQKVTLALTLAILGFCMYGFANDVAVVAIMLVLAGTIFYYFGTATAKKIKKRSDELLRDFSNVVSKLALMTNAGMILREAWEEVAFTGEGTLYEEMQRSVAEMNNGVAEADAFFEFGSRCIIPEIKKFASTVMQGMAKGNRELAAMLQQQSKEVWEQRKQDVRRQGEKAAGKLMIPIVIMFIGVLIMVIVPIFTNLGI